MSNFFRFKKIVIMLFFLLILLLCAAKGIYRIQYSDFHPLNGDFQNYNGFRRLLDGQVPFEDFYFYLGLGPLYLNSLFIFLIGDSFTNSLFVTNFITALCLATAIFVVLYLMKVNNIVNSMITLLLLIISFLQVKGFNLLYSVGRLGFFDYIDPGTSIRMQRAFLPFLTIIVIFFVFKVRYLKNLEYYYKLVIVALIIGAGIAWSNDYGVSMFLTAIIMCIILNFKELRKIIVHLAIFIPVSLLSCIMTVTVLTKGNFQEWFNYNFLGVAKYQSWYYERFPEVKFLTLKDIPFSFEIIFCTLIIIYILMRLVREPSMDYKKIGLMFIFICTLINGYAYAYSSNKAGLFEPLYLVLIVSILGYLINSIQIKRYEKVLIGLIGIIGGIFVTYHLIEAIENVSEHQGVHVAELDGYLTRFGDELNAISPLIKDKTLFSTYSSAIETINNQYHPAGIDYIIHVLGEDYRGKYMESFGDSNPEYVTTLRREFTFWEDWIMRSNWFFYREVFENYQPKYMTSYNLIWEPATEPNLLNPKDYSIKANKIDGYSYNIEVEGPILTEELIADIEISYESIWLQNRFKELGVRKLVHVNDGWSKEWDNTMGGYNLPEKANKLNLPIRIENGKGKVTINTYPIESTQLVLKEYRINKILKNPYEITKDNAHIYTNPKDLKDIPNKIATPNDFEDNIENINILEKKSLTNNILIKGNTYTIKGNDPYIIWYTDSLNAADYKFLLVDVTLPNENYVGAQVFFENDKLPFSEENSYRFHLKSGMNLVPLKSLKSWESSLETIRLDIDEMELENSFYINELVLVR